MPARLVLVVSLLLATAACGTIGAGGAERSCAALLEYAGHTYQGTRMAGSPTPTTTGRVAAGVAPVCDDGSGTKVPAHKVRVEEIAGVPMSRSVIVAGVVFVREDHRMHHGPGPEK